MTRTAVFKHSAGAIDFAERRQVAVKMTLRVEMVTRKMGNDTCPVVTERGLATEPLVAGQFAIERL